MRIPRPSRQGLIIRASVGVILLGAVIPLVNIYFATQANAASLTIASSVSETVQTTTSATFVATDTTIASGSLPAGTYLVAWGAGIGNSSSSEISTARLVRGSTEISISGSEANGGGAANNGRSPGGYWLGTLSGSEALTIEYKTSVDTTTTAAIDGKFIKAVRLDDRLVEDSDYFTTGSQESGADETTDATTASMTTVKTLTKTFGSTNQQYIVLGSMEISPDSTTNSCKAQLVVDGTVVTTQTGEGEDTTDTYNYLAADVRYIGSGSKSITLQGQSVGSATCDFMRSRIYAFRANIFDQVLENESLGESTVASTTWTDKNTQAYTPNQSEDVMIMINQLSGSDATASPLSTRIYNSTDATAHADTKSHAVNNITTDYYSGMSAASYNMSTAKTFKSQFQRPTGAGTVKIKDSRLIVWSMTLKAGHKNNLTTVGTSVAPATNTATTSTTYVDTDASIAASSLPAGKYLVMWGARPSSSDANEISWAQLVRGSTTIAEKGTESNGQVGVSGYWIGDLNGSEALKIQQKTSVGTATSNMRTKFIKAIRLDEFLVEDKDYYTTGSQESGSDEVTDATTASWTTVKSLTKTFHPATTQDYIVLADMEISNDDVSYECEARFTVDGTSSNTQTLDGEDVNDISGFVVADVVSLASGSKTISLEGKSVESAKCDYRRSRVYAFRANIFDQVVENESLGESTTNTVGTWVDKTSITYTPNQAENVVLIASHMMSCDNSGTSTAIGIYNSTDAVMYAGPINHMVNAPTGNYGTLATAEVVNVSSAKTYKGQFESYSGTTYTVKTKEARLIAWSLTLKVPQTTQGSHRWFGEKSSAWWNASWGARRKIVFDNSASAENLINFTVRVSLSAAASNIDYAKTQANGQDIRFVDSDGTPLKYEIETWNESGTSEVWVKVPQINAGSTTDHIYMYYDNASASDGQDASNTWDSNFKTVMHLDESPANGVAGHDDSTSGGHDGTPQGFAGAAGSTTNATGKISGADHFNTDDDYVGIGDHVDYSLSAYGNYTWSAWINPDTLPYWSTIWSQTLDQDNLLYIYAHNVTDATLPGGVTANGVSVWWVNGEGLANGVIADSTDNSLGTGSYQHVTVTYDASQTSGSEFKIYVDGVDVTGGGSLRGAGTADLNPANIRIGGNAPFGEYFDGAIDEVRYQTTLRSADWIEADHLSTNDGMNTFESEAVPSGEADTFEALEAQNTAATIAPNLGFTLRQIFEQTQGTLGLSSNFKLQYAERSGTCDTSFSGETYVDVPTSGTIISYYDSGVAFNRDAITTTGDDPTSSNSILTQNHVESNTFVNSINAIATGYAGMWDFSLVSGISAQSKTYCFRTISSNSILLNSYTQVAQITIESTYSGPTLEQQLRGGQGIVEGVESPMQL